jgi:hypothetical protein
MTSGKCVPVTPKVPDMVFFVLPDGCPELSINRSGSDDEAYAAGVRLVVVDTNAHEDDEGVTVYGKDEFEKLFSVVTE